MAEELGERKPNERPRSMIAQNFSTTLHSVFDIDNTIGGIGGLADSVEQKKKAVDTQTRELEALEARLRETEERLKERRSRGNSPAPPAASAAGRYDQNQPEPQQRSPLAQETFSDMAPHAGEASERRDLAAKLDPTSPMRPRNAQTQGGQAEYADPASSPHTRRGMEGRSTRHA